MTHEAPESTASVGARFVAAVRYVLRMEPVAVTAVWRAIVVLLGSAGLSISDTLDGRVVAVVAAFYVLVELLSTIRARGKVYPAAKVVEAIDERGAGTDVVVAGPASELTTGEYVRPAGSLTPGGGPIFPA